MTKSYTIGEGGGKVAVRRCPFNEHRDCIPARKYGKDYCARIERGTCRLPCPPASVTDAPYPGRGHSTSPRTSQE